MEVAAKAGLTVYIYIYYNNNNNNNNNNHWRRKRGGKGGMCPPTFLTGGAIVCLCPSTFNPTFLFST